MCALRRPPTASAAPAPQEAPAQAPQAQVAPSAVPQAAPSPAPQAQYAPSQASTAVAPRPQGGALSTSNSGMSLTDFQAEGGVMLEGFKDAPAGNFVTIDGTEFYIKSLEARERELAIVVSYAKNYYHYKDEQGQHHESDTKLHDGFQFKTRVEWLDFVEGEEEPQRFILTLPTTSAIQFNQYVRSLTSQGVHLGKIWTNMSIERLEKDVVNNGKKEKVRYSRVVFQNGGPVQFDEQ